MREGDDIWNEYKLTQAILGNEKLNKENDIEFTEKESKKWKGECNSVILLVYSANHILKTPSFIWHL